MFLVTSHATGSLLVAGLVVAIVPGSVLVAQKAPAHPVDPATHFTAVMKAHDAVARGDLAAAKAAAASIAGLDAAAQSESARPALATLKAQAARVADAADLDAAAAGVGGMLGACGDCHRATNAVASGSTPPPTAIGQTVGHMLEHQRAVALLREGLTVPSPTLWREGAQALSGAPLKPTRLPKDPKLTKDVVASEARVHALGTEALAASDAARPAEYGKVLGACASCHTLHKNVWGPSASGR